MKRKLYLHIGPHKTGTTYIQETLYRSRDLLGEVGFIYPEVGMVGKAQHRIAEAFHRGFEEEAYGYLSDLCSIQSDLVISSENFDRLSAPVVQAIARELKEFDVRLIAAKRQIDALLVSNWQEDIKHGSSSPWPRYFIDHLLRPFASPILNPGRFLTSFLDAFGEESLSLISYETAVGKGDLFTAFADAMDLGEPLRNAGSSRSINSSLPPAAVEMIRLLNGHFRRQGREPRHFVRDAFLAQRADGSSIIEDLASEIEQDLEMLVIADAFGITHMENHFRRGFEKYYINAPSELPNPPTPREFRFASESPIDPARITKIEAIAQSLEGSLEGV